MFGSGVFSFSVNFKITEDPPASDLKNVIVGCVVKFHVFPFSWYDLENTIFTNGLFWKVYCTVVMVLKTSVFREMIMTT